MSKLCPICRWHFPSTGFATRQRLNGPEPVKERSANGNLKDSAPGPSSLPVTWLDGMNIPVAVWITYNFDFNRVTTFHSEHSTFFISNISMLRRHIPTSIVRSLLSYKQEHIIKVVVFSPCSPKRHGFRNFHDVAFNSRCSTRGWTCASHVGCSRTYHNSRVLQNRCACTFHISL